MGQVDTVVRIWTEVTISGVFFAAQHVLQVSTCILQFPWFAWVVVDVYLLADIVPPVVPTHFLHLLHDLHVFQHVFLPKLHDLHVFQRGSPISSNRVLHIVLYHHVLATDKEAKARFKVSHLPKANLHSFHLLSYACCIPLRLLTMSDAINANLVSAFRLKGEMKVVQIPAHGAMSQSYERYTARCVAS